MMRCAGLSHWLDTPTDESQKGTPTTKLYLPAYRRHVLMRRIPKADLLRQFYAYQLISISKSQPCVDLTKNWW
jgi:hypothetical protein